METPPKLDNKWIGTFRRHSLQYGLLRQRVLQFLVSEHVSLCDSFERENVRSWFMLDKQYLPCTSFAQDTHHLKVIDHDLPLGLLRVHGL